MSSERQSLVSVASAIFVKNLSHYHVYALISNFVFQRDFLKEVI